MRRHWGVIGDGLVLAIVATCLAIPATARAQAPTFLFAWGFQTIKAPQGIAVDANGIVYVADSAGHIEKFTSNGALLATWGVHGSGIGQLGTPYDVAVDGAGNVYVCDYGNSKVVVLDHNGAFLREWGSFGTGIGQFWNPLGVAIDASGNVYVDDHGNSRVEIFTSTGTLVRMFALPPAADSWGIAVDGSGNVYAASQGYGQVFKYTNAGSLITQWPAQGVGIALDALGNVYVAEYGSRVVAVFTGAGAFLYQWQINDGVPGSGDLVKRVAIDPNGFAYTSDDTKGVVQKYGWGATAARDKSWGELKTMFR